MTRLRMRLRARKKERIGEMMILGVGGQKQITLDPPPPNIHLELTSPYILPNLTILEGSRTHAADEP